MADIFARTVWWEPFVYEGGLWMKDFARQLLWCRDIKNTIHEYDEPVKVVESACSWAASRVNSNWITEKRRASWRKLLRRHGGTDHDAGTIGGYHFGWGNEQVKESMETFENCGAEVAVLWWVEGMSNRLSEADQMCAERYLKLVDEDTTPRILKALGQWVDG